MNRIFDFFKKKSESIDAELFINTESILGSKYYNMVVNEWFNKKNLTEDPFQISTPAFKQHMLESISILSELPATYKPEAQDISSVFRIAFINRALGHPELFSAEEVKSMWDNFEDLKKKFKVDSINKANASLYKLYLIKIGK